MLRGYVYALIIVLLDTLLCIFILPMHSTGSSRHDKEDQGLNHYPYVTHQITKCDMRQSQNVLLRSSQAFVIYCLLNTMSRVDVRLRRPSFAPWFRVYYYLRESICTGVTSQHAITRFEVTRQGVLGQCWRESRKGQEFCCYLSLQAGPLENAAAQFFNFFYETGC